MKFQNRSEAGRKLADKLESFAGPETLVLALPRGGVPVAAQIARSLGAPLDVFLVRKIGAPSNPEYAVGAVAETGAPLLNNEAVRGLSLTPADLRETITIEQRELERQALAFRGGGGPPDVKGKTIIVVDDGLATGATATAAIRALRALGAGAIIFAAPVGAHEAAEDLRALTEAVVLVQEPVSFRAVGLWYRDFDQVEDAEVKRLLASSLGSRARSIAEGE